MEGVDEAPVELQDKRLPPKFKSRVPVSVLQYSFVRVTAYDGFQRFQVVVALENCRLVVSRVVEASWKLLSNVAFTGIPASDNVVAEANPVGVIENRETPEEDATLKMVLVPAVPCMLKPMVEEVAFMPNTVPL